MKYEAKLDKVLVILSPDMIRPDKPMDSPLLRRAVSLATATDCELELFHVCNDASLSHRLFASDDAKDEERARISNRDALRLAEIATRLRNEHINVSHEARWDTPRTDAILRKIDETRPDLVMKQGREHSYLFGLTSNTDWELARRSPTNVWLVSDKVDVVDRVVAALGNRSGDPADITGVDDYDLLQLACLIGDRFDAKIFPVNAYQLPEGQAFPAGAAARLPTPAPGITKEQREEVVKRHNTAIQTMVAYFGIPGDNVNIREGQPSAVIPSVAESVEADVIVMGANSIGRLERIMTSVTVEPVMSRTDCDILVVKERDYSGVPDTAVAPFSGIPRYDLEQAITRPDEAFGSPLELAGTTELSTGLRDRILQAWEYDIRAQMREENEGGPIADMDVDALDAIRAARSMLAHDAIPDSGRPTMLDGSSADNNASPGVS